MNRNKPFEPEEIKERQEKLRKLAEESSDLREGYSIRELVQNANSGRRAVPKQTGRHYREVKSK